MARPKRSQHGGASAKVVDRAQVGPGGVTSSGSPTNTEMMAKRQQFARKGFREPARTNPREGACGCSHFVDGRAAAEGAIGDGGVF